MARPSLLFLTAASATVATVGNAVGLAVAPEATPQTRLGVAIADDVAQRDKAAARRGRALDLREQAVRAAEARMTASPPPAAPVDPAVASANAAPVADQYDDLARIYQAMKPAAAAVVLEQLDLDVQMRVAQKMRERSTALVLAAMTPKAAAALTMALARRQAVKAGVAAAVPVARR